MRLADWLKTSTLSQTACARLLGVSQGRISQIVAGQVPSLDLALKIATLTQGRVRPEQYGDAPVKNPMTLDTVQDAIDAIARGELVVVIDDDDRENEGDLVGAAACITPQQMAFMIRHTCGIVCAPVAPEIARRLRLDPMVAVNDAPLGTAFTISVDARADLTTGISAKERSATVRALADETLQPADFVRPGHVFPLIAKSGGVLMRSGHTEAAVDLARLAGLAPAGVICELVNDDGTVQRGPQVLEFARTHGLRIISVADLIAWRQARERLVEQKARFDVPTVIGPARGFSYATPFDTVQQLALVFGDIGDGHNVPVRLHRENVIEDVFGNRHSLERTFAVFKAEKRGVLVYLQFGSDGVPTGLLAGTAGSNSEGASDRQRVEAWRDIGLGAQILRDLGVKSIRLIASSSRHYVGLSGFGIEIADTVLIDPPHTGAAGAKPVHNP